MKFHLFDLLKNLPQALASQTSGFLWRQQFDLRFAGLTPTLRPFYKLTLILWTMDDPNFLGFNCDFSSFYPHINFFSSVHVKEDTDCIRFHWIVIRNREERVF